MCIRGIRLGRGVAVVTLVEVPITRGNKPCAIMVRGWLRRAHAWLACAGSSWLLGRRGESAVAPAYPAGPLLGMSGLRLWR